jgi:hypothetical protein
MSRRQPTKAEREAAFDLQAPIKRPTWIKDSQLFSAVFAACEMVLESGLDPDIAAVEAATRFGVDGACTHAYTLERLELLHDWTPPAKETTPVHFISAEPNDPTGGQS